MRRWKRGANRLPTGSCLICCLGVAIAGEGGVPGGCPDPRYSFRMARPPLPARSDPEALERYLTLREGVPDSLLASLLGFVHHYFFPPGSRRTGLGVVSTNLPNVERLRAASRVLEAEFPEQWDAIERWLSQDDEFLLTVLDHILERIAPVDTQRLASHPDPITLEQYLAEARSAWRVGLDGNDRLELQRRQPAELAETMSRVMAAGDRASEHLGIAWSKAFGRDGDPDAACDHATKAVEVAARPVVTPNDSSATLGKMIAAMRDKPEKWTTDAEADRSVEKVTAMMQVVWQNQYRHGDETKPTASVSEACAVMSAHLAVVLVDWLRSGYIKLV